MIEGILQIGEIVRKKENLLDGLIKKIPKKKGKKQHIVFINFNLNSEQIKLDFEEVKDETPKRYLWIGNAYGNSPQTSLTTDKPEYLLSEAIPNLIERMSDCDLKEKLKQVIDTFFIQAGNSYILNPKKLDPGYPLPQIDYKERVEELKKLLLKTIKQEYNLNEADISLYTVKINGEPCAESKDYREHIEKITLQSIDWREGTCHLCSNRKQVAYKFTTDIKFKFYITDKLGFASNFQEQGFFKNFSICRDCYIKWRFGERFIENNLGTSLAGKNLYLIPKFIRTPNIQLERLETLSGNLMKAFESMKSFQKNYINAFDKFSKEAEENLFILNLLFYEKSKAEFKVLRLIEDIPPSRVLNMIEIRNRLHDKFKDMLGEEKNEWYLGLEDMYYLFPVRISKGFSVDYRKVLDFYDAIFKEKPVLYDFLIRQFVETFRIYRYGNIPDYNFGETRKAKEWTEKERDFEMIKAILKANLLLLFCKELKLLEGGESMMEGNLDLDKDLIDEDLKRFVTGMQYSEQQTALFLLGYLIGQIGSKQYSPETPTKPILKKINYRGMDKDKIIRLVNEVFDYLKIYKILPYNEIIFYQMKEMMDKNIPRWSLSDEENVFYILSGYAYATYKHIKEGKGGGKV